MDSKILAQPSGSFVKASIDGLNGSGKTWTSGLLAVGLAREYSSSAPVVVFDSEDRWRFLKTLLFDVEKVPLIIVRGRSMITLRDALAVARDEKASVFVGDQLSTPWMELVSSFSFEDGRLPIERFQQVRRTWNEAIFDFQDGRFHAIGCGRLGYNWERVENEDGKMELLQGDSKFNAGGGNNFGYECDLELELRRKKRRIAGLFRGKTSVEHVCDVIKDATSLLNGRQFIFPDLDGYKPGGYKTVLDAVRPHIDFLRSVDSTPVGRASSRELLVSGKSAWAQDQSERKNLLEEIDANLGMSFPSGEGKSKLAKMFRDLTLEYLNGFISWGRMEEESPTGSLERNLMIVKALRKRVEHGEIPTDQTSLKTLLDLSTDDVLHPGKNISLLEAMGRKSVESISAGRRSQAGD